MGNAESFHDLPEAHSQFTEAQKVPVRDVLGRYLTKMFTDTDLGEELDKLAQELDKQSEYLEYALPTEIVTKDEPADALYIMLEGDADLLMPDGDGQAEDLLCILSQHDVVGDISLFFDMPCLQTVVVHPDCCVLRIDSESVQKSGLPSLVQEHYNLEDWMVLRKQLVVPHAEGMDTKEVIRRVAVLMFRQVQLFSSWTSKQLKVLVQKMPEPMVEVYPIDSTIAGFGDRPRALLLLVRGDISVKDKFGRDILSLAVRRYPFCLGEEGLFYDDWHFPYNVTAKTTCQVLRVGLEDIEATGHAWKEQFPDEDTFRPWQTSCELWEKIRRSRDEELHQKYIARLQVEFLYRYLRASHVLPLNIYSTRCIYTIAMAGKAVEEKTGNTLKALEDHVALVMVIVGELEPSNKSDELPELWGPGEVVDCRSGKIESTDLKVRSDPCVVVQVLEDEMRTIQSKFFRKNSFV